ncbi:MAG: hypothetical protein ACR2RA_14455 [Geminicoccaceae bacterium]
MAANDRQVSLRNLDLRHAVDAGIIGADQADALWRFLTAQTAAAPSSRFDMAHMLWYTGALIVMGAMGLFTSLAFAEWGGQALSITAVLYALLFTVLGHGLWQRGLRVPGGLCVTVAVTMAPLFVFGVQEMLGWWMHDDPGSYRDFYHWIKASWLPMEAATIAAGVIALAFFRFPFLVAPIAVALWFMSMDLVPWIFGEDWNSWDQRRVVSLWFGLGMIAVAWWVDLRARQDFAFWLHLFGLAAFWGGLTMAESDSEFAKAGYCLINVILLVAAIFLQRRAYAVFGALGIASYLGHLAADVFQDSLLYPFALSFVGLLILGAGLLYYRHEATIERALTTHLPKSLQRLRPGQQSAVSG